MLMSTVSLSRMLLNLFCVRFALRIAVVDPSRRTGELRCTHAWVRSTFSLSPFLPFFLLLPSPPPFPFFSPRFDAWKGSKPPTPSSSPSRLACDGVFGGLRRLPGLRGPAHVLVHLVRFSQLRWHAAFANVCSRHRRA